ncbi:MAG: hypothetical protein WD042_17755 [Phycisphaeraceae bacterium]
MNELHLETYENRTAFAPGEALDGIASWQVEKPPRSAEVRLIWFTQGKGDRDVQTIDSVRFDQPKEIDSQIFHFTLPDEPYSFSGKLISLIWAVELVIQPGELAQRLELVVGPGGREVDIATTAEDPARPRRGWFKIG